MAGAVFLAAGALLAGAVFLAAGALLAGAAFFVAGAFLAGAVVVAVLRWVGTGRVLCSASTDRADFWTTLGRRRDAAGSGAGSGATGAGSADSTPMPAASFNSRNASWT